MRDAAGREVGWRSQRHSGQLGVAQARACATPLWPCAKRPGVCSHSGAHPGRCNTKLTDPPTDEPPPAARPPGARPLGKKEGFCSTCGRGFTHPPALAIHQRSCSAKLAAGGEDEPEEEKGEGEEEAVSPEMLAALKAAYEDACGKPPRGTKCKDPDWLAEQTRAALAAAAEAAKAAAENPAAAAKAQALAPKPEPVARATRGVSKPAAPASLTLPSPSGTTLPLPSLLTQMGELHAGDNVCVRFLEDGKWYPATVTALATDGATVEYPQTKEFLACEEELPLADLVRPDHPPRIHLRCAPSGVLTGHAWVL